MAKNWSARLLFWKVREGIMAVKSQKLLSVIIIAKNEEKMIGDCIDSAKWASDILVVDSGSSDKTVQIAKKKGAKVLSALKGTFSDWRNFGFVNSRGEWLLYIDADERVTPQLKKEIEKVVLKPEYAAYAIPRRNFVFGKEMKHCGFWPDYVKRLFLRSNFKRWTGELHEEPIFKGELGHLKNPMIHLKHSSIEGMVDKTNEWSEIEAKLMFEAKHPIMNIPRFLSAMFREFWLRMIIQKAFLDGTEGVIYALYQIYSRLISYAKLWEMQIAKK